MTSDSPLPEPEVRLTHAADQPAWADAELHEHPDPELLAAYAEGNLAETAIAACEEHLSRCPACLDLVRDLWDLHLAHCSGLRPARESTKHWRIGWLFQAACLLIGIGGIAWGFLEWHSRRGELQRQARLEQELLQTRMQLAVACKEQFLARSSSPVRNYWSTSASLASLQLPRIRGAAELPADAIVAADEARRHLELLAEIPQAEGSAILELASLEIVAGRREIADAHLRHAERLVGAAPELENLRALWLLGQGDQQSVEQAKTILRGLTQLHPDYLPARYNLALLLEQAFQDAESRQAWHEYLQRESRAEFRKLAETHLKLIQ